MVRRPGTVQIVHPAVIDRAVELTQSGRCRNVTEGVEYLAIKGAEALDKQAKRTKAPAVAADAVAVTG